MALERNLGQTRRLIRHGLMVLVVGLLCGFGLAFAINDSFSISPIPISFEYNLAAGPRAWRAAHVGGITNGLMALLFAALLPYLALRNSTMSKVVTGIIVVIWGNVIFYLASLFAPNRSLSFGDTVAGDGNLAGAIGYVSGVSVAVLMIWIAIYLIITIPRSHDL